MKIAFTGHTCIERIFGTGTLENGNVYDNASWNLLVSEFQLFLEKFMDHHRLESKDITIISGMARGIDEVAAIVAINNNIKLICAVPHSLEYHKNRGPSRGIRCQAIWYDYILGYPNIEIHEVKKDYGSGHKFANFARNAFMVDISNTVVSYKMYDSVGTDHCIKYAKKNKKYFGNIPEMRKTK